jgi:hypothetical protein
MQFVDLWDHLFGGDELLGLPAIFLSLAIWAVIFATFPHTLKSTWISTIHAFGASVLATAGTLRERVELETQTRFIFIILSATGLHRRPLDAAFLHALYAYGLCPAKRLDHLLCVSVFDGYAEIEVKDYTLVAHHVVTVILLACGRTESLYAIKASSGVLMIEWY